MLAFLGTITGPAKAIYWSVFVGAVFTYVQANVAHWWLRRKYPQIEDREPALGAINGMLQRGLITTLVIWLPEATGAVVAGILASHAIMAWGNLDPKQKAARARYKVALINLMVSIVWALCLGLRGRLA